MNISDDSEEEIENLSEGPSKRKRKDCVADQQVRRRIRQEINQLIAGPSSQLVQEDYSSAENFSQENLSFGSIAEDDDSYPNPSNITPPVDVATSDITSEYLNSPYLGDQDKGDSALSGNPEEWYDAQDWGVLNYLCDVCISCFCDHCDICRHDPQFINCNHCQVCVEGTFEWNDARGGDEDINDESLSDDEGVVLSSEESLQNNMSNDLINISLQHNLNHGVLDDFLKFIRKYGIGRLPLRAKTLLKTPLKVVTRSVTPGLYWHNGLIKVVHLYVSETGCSSVDIKWSFDSVPISNSSSSSFSPLSCSFNDSADVYLIGVYHGIQKPDDPNDLLREFVEEAKSLSENGFCKSDGIIIPVSVKCSICDAPAKSFLLKCPGHNAYFGCSKCQVEGEFLDRRMSYVDLDAPLKTDDNVYSVDNIASPSILGEIPSFGLVSSFPLDYMHLVLLGVVRKLMYMWMSGPLSVRLSGKEVNKLSEALIALVGYIPKDFVRRPRSLQFIKRFKATEFRQILLYTGPVVLVNLPSALYEHFLVLHVAILILCHPEFSISKVQYANSLLRYFVETFSDLYGSQYISHNVHGLIHLADDVSRFGSLDKFSAFPYENFYQSLKKLVRKGEKPLIQLARRYGEFEQKKANVKKSMKQSCESAFFGCHSGGPCVPECACPQYHVYRLQGGIVLDVKSEANNTCLLYDGSIVIAINFATHSINGTMMMLGRKFSVMEDLYTTAIRSSKLGIYVVSKPSPLEAWPVSAISKKCCRMPHKNGFAVVPLLHSEQLVIYIFVLKYLVVP